MLKIMQYHQRLNLNVTIFILNMLFLNYILLNEKTAVENALTSNGFFVKKEKNATDFTKLKF